MITAQEINNYLLSVFPAENAMEYDNVGLLVGEASRDIKKIYIALDCTMSVVESAIQGGYDMIITHHPLIFGGISRITSEDINGSIVLKLAQNRISYCALHTNLDYRDEYSNSCIVKRIWGDSAKIKAAPKDKAFCGVVAEIPTSSLTDTVGLIKQGLNASGVITLSENREVRRIFVQGGALDEDSVPFISDAGIDLVVSGEIKHHICVLLENMNISSIIAGHNATERTYLPTLKQLINDKYPDLEIFVDFGNESFM